ncbi:response regulator [Acidothermaceae bacterium B102]|nr:response regulator [Acidothermaceae bacterium B102]
MPSAAPDSLTVLVYSSHAATREKVLLSLGRRPAPDIARLEYIECAKGDEVLEAIDAGGVDLLILDGESTPEGGMGLARQLKNERTVSPPILLLIGRRDDRWLAHWSQTDAAVPHPIDAIELAEVTAELLRRLVPAATAVVVPTVPAVPAH